MKIIEKEIREKMKKEAITRLKMLKLHQNVIYDFETKDKLNKSEGTMAILYWLDNKENEFVRKFEEKHNVLVYHVIKTYTKDYGAIYDFLYIDEDENYWEEEKEDIKNGYVKSYTIFLYSESGDICIKSKNGGLIRKY